MWFQLCHDKCGSYKVLGAKNCRSCWGDPTQDVAKAATKVESEVSKVGTKVGCELTVAAGGRGYVAVAGIMANRASSPAEKFTDDEKVIVSAVVGQAVVFTVMSHPQFIHTSAGIL